MELKKKPSAQGIAILEALRGAPWQWVTTTYLLNHGVHTTCIHKRLSELIDLGVIEKKPAENRKRKVYRLAREVSPCEPTP